MARLNEASTSLINSIRNSAGLEFKNRIPPVTQANIKDATDRIFNYPGPRNAFMSALINQVAHTIISTSSWENPLAFLKGGKIDYGFSVQELAAGLVKSIDYDPNRMYGEADLFGQNRLDVQTMYHTVNRQNTYKMTINEAEIKQACYDENGLSQYLNVFSQAVNKSDNLDEFLLTVSLLRDYEDNGGFYKIKIPDITGPDSYGSSGTDSAQIVLRRIRETIDNLAFIKTKYNAAHMPMSINPKDLLLIGTPEFFSAIDVNALAGAFNMPYADTGLSQIKIPKDDLGIDEALGFITSKDFFRIYDTQFATEYMYNPAGLYSNSFTRHWQIISYSTVTPIVMLSTKNQTNDPIYISKPPTTVDISVTDENGATVTSLVAGHGYVVKATQTFEDETDDNNSEVPVILHIKGNDSFRTTIDNNGNLMVDLSETATALSVVADITVKGETKTVECTVGGTRVTWPVQKEPAPAGTTTPPASTPTSGDGK